MPLLSVASFFTAISLWPIVNEDKGWLSLYQKVCASATCNLHLYKQNQLCVCSLQWRYNERDVVSNHWRLDYLLNRLFRRRSRKTPKLSVTGLCDGESTSDRKCFHLMTSSCISKITITASKVYKNPFYEFLHGIDDPNAYLFVFKHTWIQ